VNATGRFVAPGHWFRTPQIAVSKNYKRAIISHLERDPTAIGDNADAIFPASAGFVPEFGIVARPLLLR